MARKLSQPAHSAGQLTCRLDNRVAIARSAVNLALGVLEGVAERPAGADRRSCHLQGCAVKHLKLGWVDARQDRAVELQVAESDWRELWDRGDTARLAAKDVSLGVDDRFL